MPITIYSPNDAVAIPLADVNEPIFASGALGAGVGLRPGNGQFVAPVAGTLVTVMPHAYGIETADGVQVLIHIGIDTVELGGQHFEPLVTVGDVVEQGDALVHANLDAIGAAGFDCTTIVVVPNAASLRAVEVRDLGPVVAGVPLIDVTA